MSCGPAWKVIREAAAAGILIELDGSGNLRLRASNEPPRAVVEHVRQHKQDIVAFLRAKAAAEDGERRIVAASQQKRTSRRREVPKRQAATALEQSVLVLATPPLRPKR
jgi:hypothetical protein